MYTRGIIFKVGIGKQTSIIERKLKEKKAHWIHQSNTVLFQSTNVHSSTLAIIKSSLQVSRSLLNVRLVHVRPWYKSPSIHNPCLPLKFDAGWSAEGIVSSEKPLLSDTEAKRMKIPFDIELVRTRPIKGLKQFKQSIVFVLRRFSRVELRVIDEQGNTRHFQ